ncbi:hypothetical protein [Pantoea sp. 18069]|uniref:hypothetical protein n=1 Tax=Pantoea sp. 18069 TaxID=2681415 RepID=UPI001358A849|nr:hypothetical protein [Pantoea sp. 18069]
MQSLRTLYALLSVCVLTSAAALGAVSQGTAASEQMAAKRRISMQFRQDMQQCENLDGDAAELCERQAHGWAEAAKAELEARRQHLAQGRQTREVRTGSHHKIAQARCNALSGRVKERCSGGAARTAS